MSAELMKMLRAALVASIAWSYGGAGGGLSAPGDARHLAHS